MIKDHSDSERGNPLPPNGQGFFYVSSLRQDNTYHGLCYTSRGALAGTRNRSMVICDNVSVLHCISIYSLCANGARECVLYIFYTL